MRVDETRQGCRFYTGKNMEKKTTTGTDPKGQRMKKGTTKKKNTKETPRTTAVPDLGKVSPELQALLGDRRREQKEAAEESRQASADLQDLSEYSFFHMDRIKESLFITPEMLRKARSLVKKEKAHIARFEVAPFKEQYKVESDGYDPEQIVGSLALTCESDARHSFFMPSFRVDMCLGQDELLWSRCGNWGCSCGNWVGEQLCVCEHAMAGILLLEEYLKSHTDIDTTTSGAQHLMQALGTQGGVVYDAKEGLAHEALNLEPFLEVRDDGCLRLCFRVGTGRLYKVKNLREFYTNMQQGRKMVFSAKTTLLLSENDLTGESKSWYRFFAEEFKEEQTRLSRYFSGRVVPDLSDSLELDGRRLDSFLEMSRGRTLEVNYRLWDYRGKEYLTLRDKAFVPSLTIRPDTDAKQESFEGVVVEGSIPKIYKGVRSGCWIEGTHLNCMNQEELARIQPVLETAGGSDKVSLRVGRYKLADFYHKSLPQLRQIANITETGTEQIFAYLPPEPSFTIYLDLEGGSILCRAEAAYGAEVFSVSDVADGEMRPYYEKYRDEQAERLIVLTILKYFPKFDHSLKLFFVDKSAEQVFDLLEHGLDELGELPLCQIRMTERFRRLGLRRHVSFDMGVSMENNLLDLSVTARELTEDEMLDVLYQYQKKRRFVVLKNGDFLKLEDNESIRQLLQLMEDLHLSVKEITKGKMHLPAYRALYLDKMLENQEGLYSDRDRHFKELIKGFKTVADSDYEIPAHLKKTLRPYQKEGYRWLRTLDHYGFGGILADEMGLGKTLQVLTMLEAVRGEEAGIEGRARTALVICPASLVYNWLEEAHRFAPSLKAAAVTGNAVARAGIIAHAEEMDLLITSYDLLKRDIAEYDGHQFRFEIIDEAQYIKTHTTAAAKSVKLVQAITKLALTGTPIENRLSELWSIFDYLMPGFLFAYENFRVQMEVPIVKNENQEALERLHRMIAPFILRRNKKDVLKDLPDKLEEVRFAGMSGKQQKLYDAQVMRIRKNLEQQDENDFRRGKIEILAELMRIRQLCCDPSLCYTNYDGESAKTDLCMELLHSLMDGGHKTLLFSQFTSMLEILQHRLEEEHIPYYMITGSTAKEERLELVKAFNQNDVPVFLISLKAGGTGLNLVGADSVIHYDPWWNTAAEDQASDRAHRIGQKNVVTVYKLVAKGTIEEKIIELQKQKAQLASDILGGEGVGSASFSREDLLEILE